MLTKPMPHSLDARVKTIYSECNAIRGAYDTELNPPKGETVNFATTLPTLRAMNGTGSVAHGGQAHFGFDRRVRKRHPGSGGAAT
jgi:hypothetical protein